MDHAAEQARWRSWHLVQGRGVLVSAAEASAAGRAAAWGCGPAPQHVAPRLAWELPPHLLASSDLYCCSRPAARSCCPSPGARLLPHSPPAADLLPQSSTYFTEFREGIQLALVDAVANLNYLFATRGIQAGCTITLVLQVHRAYMGALGSVHVAACVGCLLALQAAYCSVVMWSRQSSCTHRRAPRKGGQAADVGRQPPVNPC